MKINKYRAFNIGIQMALPLCAAVNKQYKGETLNFKLYEKRNLFTLEPLPKAEVDVSLIIPVYNSEKFLPRCLESIEKQKTKYSYEVVLVDDGSTDGSAQIINEFVKRNSNFKVISQKNQGISAARNTGLVYSKGKYIGFIDNDDFITSDYCETLLDLAFKYNADIVKCGHVRYDLIKEQEVAFITNPSTYICGEIGNQITEYKGFIWGGLYSRQMFTDIRFPVGFWFEDMVVRLLLMRKSRAFVFENRALYYYALHTSNASKKVWKKNQIKALDQLYLAEYLSEYGEEIGLGKANGLYEALLIELGPVLWMRTRQLEEAVRKKAFIEAADFINQYKIEYKNSNLYHKYLKKAFIDRNYLLWKMASIYYMCDVKAKNKK